MTEVGAYDAKTNLGQLLNRVATGERILITRHGMPVAMLQPVPPSKGMPAEQAIAELKAFRQGRRLDRLSLREMIDEGRA